MGQWFLVVAQPGDMTLVEELAQVNRWARIDE